jgi:hypothetical protein
MRVCLTLSGVHALTRVEDSVFALVELLEKQCDSIAVCEIFVEYEYADRPDAASCVVRLALQVFGEKINVVGIGAADGDDASLQSALLKAYRSAVSALRAVACMHQGCSSLPAPCFSKVV